MGSSYFAYRVPANKKSKYINEFLYHLEIMFNHFNFDNESLRGLQKQIFCRYYFFINHLISACLSNAYYWVYA